MTCVRGPNSPSLNQQFAGCLIDAFDKPPTFMMVYNKPYYAKLIESQGFVKSQDLLAYYCEKSMLGNMNPKLQLVVDEAHKRFPDMVTRRVNTKHIKQDLETFVHLYNEGLRSVWGFVPMSDTEAASVASSLKLLIIPELTTVIEIGGKAVAICFSMLDYNPIIKKINGNLFPFGIFYLLFGKRTIKKARIIGAYVSPEYQRWGLGIVLMSRMLPDILNWGITEAEFSYVVESNRPSRGTLERGGAILDKTYRMYDREL
jgi:GNAT superfamily N-acetyltransferase